MEERNDRFRRYFFVAAAIAQRANREAARAHAPDESVTEGRTVESVTADWILALILDPEILSYLMAERTIDIGAVRRRRARLSDSGPALPIADQTGPTTGSPSPKLNRVFEAVVSWALSDSPDVEVAKWRPHSDLRTFMSTLPPDADDDPWPPERIRARVYRYAVIRELFERFLQLEDEAVRDTLDDIGLTEQEFERCLDILATRYVLDAI